MSKFPDCLFEGINALDPKIFANVMDKFTDLYTGKTDSRFWNNGTTKLNQIPLNVSCHV